MSRLRSLFFSTVGLSRHSAASVLSQLGDSAPASFARQLLSLLAGSSLIGIAVAFLVRAELGQAPYDVLVSALAELMGSTQGQAGWALAAGFFAVAALVGKRPSSWGVGFIVANGVAIDVMVGLVRTPAALPARIAFVAGAIGFMAAGISLVIHSGTTGGPFELIMAAGDDHSLNPTIVRYGLDIGVLVAGIALGGDFGPATVAYALSFGIVLRVIAQALSDHRSGRRARLDAQTTTQLSGGPRQVPADAPTADHPRTSGRPTQ